MIDEFLSIINPILMNFYQSSTQFQLIFDEFLSIINSFSAYLKPNFSLFETQKFTPKFFLFFFLKKETTNQTLFFHLIFWKQVIVKVVNISAFAHIDEEVTYEPSLKNVFIF
jgi:hypothetical protein